MTFLEAMNFNVAGDNPLSHVLPHPIQKIAAGFESFLAEGGEITVLSDQIIMMVAATMLLALFVPAAVRRRLDDSETGRLVPRGLGGFVEAVCQYFRDEVAKPNIGEEHTDRFIKYIWSAFFFVLTINLLGLIPLGTVTPLLLGVPIGGTATANIWVTSTLAILTLVLMVFNGLRLGGKAYIAHFNPGPVWLAPLLVPLELVGLVAKTFALAVRLFANMMAGHILLAVLIGLVLKAGTALGTGGGLAIGLIVVAGSVAITMLEIFVAFLQAYIFAYLTALFIGMSVNLHHDDHHEHGEAAAH